MKTIEEQIANRCIHFNGIMNKTCHAGVKYEDVRVGRPYLFPCLKTGGECSKCQFPTQEEVEAEVKKDAAMLNRAMTLLSSIKSSKNSSGTTPCTCGGTVTWGKSYINGHARSSCDKCGMTMME